MRSAFLRGSSFGIVAYAITAGCLLIVLRLLYPALPFVAAAFVAWLLGGLAALALVFGLTRRETARAALSPRDGAAGPAAGPEEPVSERLNNLSNEITAAADLVGDIAGSTEAVMYKNDQAMRPIVVAVEQMAQGAAGQSQSTQKTALMAEQLAEATAGIASGAAAQATSIARAHQLNRRVLKIVEDANQIASSAQQAGGQTADNMDAIRGSVTTAAEKVQTMSKRSDDIRMMLGMLEDIAAQTRFLTINAALEAARAGESGRGFAMVAIEVRRLSESSEASVVNIRRLVGEIIKASQESMDSMKHIDERVDDGVRSVKHAAQTLDEIAAAFRGIQGAVSELSAEMQAIAGVVEENTAATEQMALNSRQVRSAMEQVTGITLENQAAIEQINGSIANISNYIIDASVSTQSLLDMAYSIQSAIAPLQKRQAMTRQATGLTQPRKKLKLGLVQPFYLARPFWKKMGLFAQKAAEDLGAELLILEADDDPQRMWNNYQSLLERGVDGIMSVPYYDLGERMLEAAARRSTPVILLDTYLRGVQPQIGAYKNYAAFVGPSNAGVGYRIADYLFTCQPNSRVAALMGQSGHITGIQRTKGLEYALRKYDSVRLVAKSNCDFTREDGDRTCSAMLDAHPDINAVWTMTDQNALGAIDAIRRCGKVPGRDVLVVGMDLDEESVRLVQTGEQLCDASVHWMQAGLGLVVLHDVLNGHNIPYQRAIIKLNLAFLTAAQVSSYTSQLSDDGLLPFDFRQFSRVFNPAAQVGQFAVTV